MIVTDAELEIPFFLRRPQPPKETPDMPRKPRKAKDIEAENEQPQEQTAAPEPAGNGIGHNSKAKPELTDADLQALAFQHKKAYAAALAAKKAADAALKNVCKLAKAELGNEAVATIKAMIELETEEGEEKIRARIETQLRAARWMAVPLGQQADMFGDTADRTPAVDRARAEGKRDGMDGKTLKPPYDQTVPQHDAYVEGWNEGQKAIFNIQKMRDAGEFDAADETAAEPLPLGDAEPTHTVSH